MAHFAKYKLADVGPVIGEHERTPETCAWRWAKEPSEDMYLDRDRVSQNFIVGDDDYEDDVDMRLEIEDAIAEHNENGRAFRSDGVAMGEWVVTLPLDWPRERDPRELWDSVIGFMRERYGGEDNVPVGYVHMDEGRPHVHVPVVPMEDGRMRSSRMFTRGDLRTFHDDLERHVCRELGMERVGLRLTDEERQERTARYVDLPRFKEAQRGFERAEEQAEQARQRLESLRQRERRALISNRELGGRAGDLASEVERARQGTLEREEALRQTQEKERALKEEHSRLAQVRERLERGIEQLKRGVERARERLVQLREQVRERLNPVAAAMERLERLSEPMERLAAIDERMARAADDDPGAPAADALERAREARDAAREAADAVSKEHERLAALAARPGELEGRLEALSAHKLRNRAEIKEVKAELEQARRDAPSWEGMKIAEGAAEKAAEALQRAERALEAAPAAIEAQTAEHERCQALIRDLATERDALNPAALVRQRDEAIERYYALDDPERGQVAMAMIQREPDGYMARQVALERVEELADDRTWRIDDGETAERDEAVHLLERLGEWSMGELFERLTLKGQAQVQEAWQRVRMPNIERAAMAAQSQAINYEREQDGQRLSMGMSR